MQEGPSGPPFLRGGSRLLFSSKGLGWSGLLLEQRELFAGDWPTGELRQDA
jgi:hypothetical protein